MQQRGEKLLQNHHLLLEQQLAVQGLLRGRGELLRGDPGAGGDDSLGPPPARGQGFCLAGGVRQVFEFSGLSVGFFGHIKIGHVTPLHLIIIRI